MPAVLHILFCYARHGMSHTFSIRNLLTLFVADLWSIIRDIIAYKLNIPQNEYTIYEPSSVLCDGEFQKYREKSPFFSIT